jgi:glucose/arabinose dehydrogenase
VLLKKHDFFSARRREIFLSKELIQRKRYGAKAIAPSGMMVYNGDRFSQWHGDIFVGRLRSQDIRRIDLDDAGRVIAQTALRIGH